MDLKKSRTVPTGAFEQGRIWKKVPQRADGVFEQGPIRKRVSQGADTAFELE